MDSDGLLRRNPLARWLDQAENVGVAWLKMTARDAPIGSICRFQGEWGVKEKGDWLDTWDVGRVPLKPTDILDVLPPNQSLPSTRERRPKGPPPDPR